MLALIRLTAGAMNLPSLTLGLDRLKSGSIGMSAVYGAFLAEAASHCLKANRHPDPVALYVTGDDCFVAHLGWCDSAVPDDATWADPQEATEYGAYGIAIVVALPLTKTSRVERSARGPGIDYWMGDSRDQTGIFQRSARLEVSGILKGDNAKIAARLKEKISQTNRSASSGLSAYVAIVEFSAPEARLVRKATELSL